MSETFGAVSVLINAAGPDGKLGHRVWRRSIAGTSYEMEYLRSTPEGVTPLVTVTAIPVACLNGCDHAEDECGHLFMWQETTPETATWIS